MARRGFSGAVMRGVGARDHILTVTGTEQLAPHFLRVHLVCDTLLEDMQAGPTAWIRIWFPDPDRAGVEHQRGYTLSSADPATGTFTVDFVLHEPAGPASTSGRRFCSALPTRAAVEHQRGYTLSSAAPAPGTFTVDFVLHEPAGPASTWAVQAEPGQQVPAMTMGSTPFEVPTELPAGYLLIGDSASTPALNAIVATVPDEVPIELYLEQHEEADRLIPLTGHPRLVVHRVPRTGPEALAAAIERRDWSNWYAWIAPESASLKQLRTLLRDEFGFPKTEIHQQAYWVEGRAMGKRRGGDASAPAVRPETGPAAERTSAQGETAPAAEPAPAQPMAWRANASGRLLAPLRSALLAAGILQALVTMVQLAPFVLLVELARRLLGGAGRDGLWTLGLWAVALLAAGALLETALLGWLHAKDARFSTDLRHRLLGHLARLPLGWFTARDSGRVKKLVQDDTLSLHYLITHAVPDAVAAVVAPVSVLVYLFVVDWRLGLVLLAPVLVYIV